ncbi:hypothetical protein Droror1_Dr00021611 [Drosera rotundifolia]
MIPSSGKGPSDPEEPNARGTGKPGGGRGCRSIAGVGGIEPEATVDGPEIGGTRRPLCPYPSRYLMKLNGCWGDVAKLDQSAGKPSDLSIS